MRAKNKSVSAIYFCFNYFIVLSVLHDLSKMNHNSNEDALLYAGFETCFGFGSIARAYLETDYNNILMILQRAHPRCNVGYYK